jgi:hypothetical protein
LAASQKVEVSLFHQKFIGVTQKVFRRHQFSCFFRSAPSLCLRWLAGVLGPVGVALSIHINSTVIFLLDIFMFSCFHAFILPSFQKGIKHEQYEFPQEDVS